MRWKGNPRGRSLWQLLPATLAIALFVAPSAFAEEAAEVDLPNTDDQTIEVELGPDNVLNPQQTPDTSFIYDTSINDLATADPYMDGQTVQVRGEVVGDRINAEFDPGHCWIVLQALGASDATTTVFMSKSLSDSIDTYGAYGRVGTTLQVQGTFNLACVDHSGLTDLHAEQVTVVKKGYAQEPPFQPGVLAIGIFLVLVGAGLLFLFWRVRESRR